jgi:hypothetical protein
MYSGNAHLVKSTVDAPFFLHFQLTLGGSGNPTIVYGASWIALATHAGGGNVIVVTLKESIYAVVDGKAQLWDASSPGGKYATFGDVVGQASTTGAALTFQIATFAAGGGASNDATGTVSGYLLVNNGSVVT